MFTVISNAAAQTQGFIGPKPEGIAGFPWSK